ncbi:hypothetical protein V8E36_004090 [Tilletia maclaganii]
MNAPGGVDSNAQLSLSTDVPLKPASVQTFFNLTTDGSLSSQQRAPQADGLPPFLASRPLSLLPHDDLTNDSDDTAELDLDDDAVEDAYTGQHASVVTASAILSRSGAVFPYPVHGSTSASSSYSGTRTRRRRSAQYSPERPGSISWLQSRGDVSLPAPSLEGDSGDRRQGELSGADDDTGAPGSSPRMSPQGRTSVRSRRNTATMASTWSPFLHGHHNGSTWLPPLDIGAHAQTSSASASDAPPASSTRRSSTVEEDGQVNQRRPQLPPRVSQSSRPRPRQRASNGSALEALGALLLHSREAKGRPSVLSFARPTSALVAESDPDEFSLSFLRGSDEEGDRTDGGGYDTGSGADESQKQSKGGRARRRSVRVRAANNGRSAARAPTTPCFHAPSSFLFAGDRPALSDSVKEGVSEASTAPQQGTTRHGPGRASRGQQASSSLESDDRTLWFRRFFDQQGGSDQQSLNLPFGLRFPTAQGSSLLTAKGRSSTLTIAERRARRFLLGSLAENGRSEDPFYRLAWTRRNQPSFLVERHHTDVSGVGTSADTPASSPSLSASALSTSAPVSTPPIRKQSTDDSTISPVLRSPLFRRARSEYHSSTAVPRPTFPYACDEPGSSMATTAVLRRRKRWEDRSRNDASGLRDNSHSPPAVSLAGILGPTALPNLPEAPPSPLAMPGGWVGSQSYRRSGRRAWLWWEGKGDDSPDVSFDSLRSEGGTLLRGSQGKSRTFSTESADSEHRKSTAGQDPPARRGLLSIPSFAGGPKPQAARTDSSKSATRRQGGRRSSAHLFEDGALWLPPPLLDDAGSSAVSFEGLLGIKRMRQQEEARKQLERLRARNRPTHKPGLITALGNFVKAAHAAELSHTRLAKEALLVQGDAGSVDRSRLGSWMKRPGMSTSLANWRSLSAFELPSRGQRGFGTSSAAGGGTDNVRAAKIAANSSDDDSSPDGGHVHADEDGDAGTAVHDAAGHILDADVDDQDEDPEAPPGSRLWWDRFFSGSLGKKSALVFDQANARTDVVAAEAAIRSTGRPGLYDRSFTEPALVASLTEDGAMTANKADSNLSMSGREPDAVAAPTAISPVEDKFIGPPSAPSRDVQVTGSSSEGNNSSDTSDTQSHTATKHVAFSTPVESPRLAGTTKKSATLPLRSSEAQLGSPMRELPHAPRLVPIHISNPASPMTPLITDASDAFHVAVVGGRSRSSSASTCSPSDVSPRFGFGNGHRGGAWTPSLDVAPRGPKLGPTQMSLPPSPWTENGVAIMAPISPELRVSGLATKAGGATTPKRRSISTLSPLMRTTAIPEEENEVDAQSRSTTAGEQAEPQILYRLSAEHARPAPSGSNPVSPRLIPTKLEIIASPLLRSTDRGERAKGLGISSPDLTPIKDPRSSHSIDKEQSPNQKRPSVLLPSRHLEMHGQSTPTSADDRLTPTALFMSRSVPGADTATSISIRPKLAQNGGSLLTGPSSHLHAPPAMVRTHSSTSTRSRRSAADLRPPKLKSQHSSGLTNRKPQRSFFLWLLIGDLFLGTDPSVAAKAIDPSKTPPGTVEMGPIAGVISHLVGFTVFVLAHVLDLATNVWENTLMTAWFVRWLFLNLTGRTVLSRCIYEVYLLVRDEWQTVAMEDHEDRAGARGRKKRRHARTGSFSQAGPSRRGSWANSAAAGPDEDGDEEDEGDDERNVFEQDAAALLSRRKREPVGLSGWQIIRGLTELACLQAVTRERYLAEGAGLERLRGWKKRRKGRGRKDTSRHGSIDPAAFSNSSVITELSLDHPSDSEDESEEDVATHETRTPNAYKSGDDEDLNRSPNTTTTATTQSSVVPSEDEDDDESDESEDEMIVTRQDVDVLEFTKTPKSSHGGVPGAGARPAYDERASSRAASSYFPFPQAQQTPAGTLPGRTPLTRPFHSISSALEFGMTPLRAFPQAERSLDPDQPASTSAGSQAHPPISENEEENETRANTSKDDSQIRKHGALWSTSARDLVKTIKWASRMAISAYGLHVHIVDLPPTFTPSGKRFNRQTFAHLSRLNPDDVLHAEIQTLDSEAAYQPTFYIVRDFVRRVIVVSVRGTQSFSDIIVDLDINVESVALPALRTTADDDGDGGQDGAPAAAAADAKGKGKEGEETEWIREPALKAHAGIWRAAKSLIKPGSVLFDTLRGAMEELDGFGVVFTGHSLGAAIASAVSLLISEYKPLVGGQSEEEGVWLTRAGTGLPAGRPIRTIAFANPAVVSAALADRAALGVVPLVTTVVLGSDVIPRAGHGQARELRRVLGALSRVRRRHTFRMEEKGGGKDTEAEAEDARVHIVRSWWDWRSICAAEAEAEDEAEGGSSHSSSRRRRRDQLGKAAGLDAVALDRKERIEEQLWKLRCDVEADLYAAVKSRMQADSAGGPAGLRTPGLSPWIGPAGSYGGGGGPILHKLATRRQKLDMATLASEVREEERAEGGRVMLLPAGRSLLIEGGEVYVVGSPLSFFSLPELTPKMLADHLPSAYEAAAEEDLVL